MKRPAHSENTLERLKLWREKCPELVIRSTFVVGFPGENREDFLDTYNFLNDLAISYLHVFTYSERENTPAIDLPDSVPGSQRADRNKMLHILSEKKRRAFYESQLESTAEVLFEADQKEGYMHGFTRNYVKVKTPYDPLWVNELKTVSLQAIAADGDVEILELNELITHS
jgi:threonylcarbamoyladenosine tRNA methylthiotransferase MtaB